MRIQYVGKSLKYTVIVSLTFQKVLEVNHYIPGNIGSVDGLISGTLDIGSVGILGKGSLGTLGVGSISGLIPGTLGTEPVGGKFPGTRGTELGSVGLGFEPGRGINPVGNGIKRLLYALL